MRHHDVVVIGTGLAGLTAAVRLAERGARVLVLAKGVGATHLSAGTIDLLGYAPERVERPGEALRRLVAERPDHPYAVAGDVGAAVDWLTALVADGSLAPYAYQGGLDENLLLPTALGVPRPSAVVPETMAGGDLRRDDPILVVGFRGFKDFHPALLADTLRRAGFPARATELEVAPEGRADVNSLGYARAFDDPGFRAEVTA
ncbi:MAG: FAD-dependent oxidoreductase, partial [Thermoleophilaceae bacterium]